MITSSIVTYITTITDEKKNEIQQVVRSACNSIIDKIIIVDNSPTRELSSFVSGLSDKISYIFNNANLGYGAAHNIGLRKAMDIGADYHIILNPDIYFESGTIEALFSYMNTQNDVGAVMPLIKYPNGDVQYLCKLQPTPFDLIGRRFLPKRFTLERNNRYELRHSSYNQVMNVPCLSGCFMFLRVNILNDTGLFDDRFFMYCEDFDFYKRIHLKYKTIFFPDVSVVHAHKKESYINKKLLKMHIKSAIKYFNKWGWFFDASRRKANREILDYLNNSNK